MKTLGKIVTAGVLALGLLSTPGISHANDIVPGSALEIEMKAMIERGVLMGYPDGSYKPSANVTREQFAAFISRALTLPDGQHSFKDVAADSALGKEVGKVSTAGIMEGVSSERFAPDALITRDQVAMTIENMIEYTGMELKPKRMEFTDASDMNSVTLNAVFNIANYEVVFGYPNNNVSPVTYSFKPKNNATRDQAAAFIFRFLTAYEATPVEEPPVEEPPTPEPAPVDNKFYLGYVENGKLVKQEYGHDAYLSAAESFKNTASADALYKGDEIIRVKSGVAYADRVINNQGVYANIYLDSAFTKPVTYIEYGREIRYIDANDQYVKVQVGGTIGYAKHSEVDFVPSDLMVDRDYYIVNQWGTLTFHQYNYAKKAAASYSIGPAPAGMQGNVKYYSHDGVHFSAGSSKVKHYPYFQYQSIRTKTNYTAEDLDRYITQRLSEVNNISSKYKDAATKSKLIGTGKDFIAIQNQYNVNALYMLAAAMHESDLGMSANAQTKNNLFGIKVYDAAPENGTAYKFAVESINDFARDYMNGRYVNPNGAYPNGAAPGNKTAGVNVKYASDPTWGSKVAGHMFRIDLALGQKDIGKHKLGITKVAGVNVRTAPLGDKLYTYNRTHLGVDNAFGYPVVILETKRASDGYDWYKISSDLNPEHDTNGGVGWIRSDLVNLIN
ncbi:S-layer homology domain-containing protein [Planococcus chinensis]|uniref:S-layer homology domain-containing protein n=1 Tax=Planococcus chinensis TaxID=272917 RepID=A0ABW4QEB0_9BACL